MALILSLEASADFCSVALHEEGILIAADRIREPRAAASALAPAIKKILIKTGINSEKLQAIALASGPGSYTGLRIVSSIAKGMATALDLPLIAVNTLTAMFSKVDDLPEYMFYCPTLDARRNEVYLQLFDHHRTEIIPTTSVVIEEGFFKKYLDQGPILFFGNGALKTITLLAHPNARQLNEIEPDAEQVGILAYEYWKAGKLESPVTFQPLYLKEFFIGRKPG